MTWTNINGNKIHWDGAVRANGWTDAHPRLDRRLETHSPLMRHTRSTIALIYCRLRYTFFLLWRMGSGTRDPLIIDDKWPASISKRVRFFFQWAGRRDTFRRTCPCIQHHFFFLKGINQKQWSDAWFFFSSYVCSLISSGSCWDQGGIPWRDYKRRQEWRCPSSEKVQWGIKTR